MEWSDNGIILTCRAHGETAAVVSLLTEHHGRHAGLVPQGQSPRGQGSLQIGNHVEATWSARLLDHLGTYQLDVLSAPLAHCLDNPEKLAIIASATALTEICLPERQPMGGVYAGLLTLLHLEDTRLWGPVYVKWEMELLRALGYGLDLSTCAVTGATEDLSFVSPKTGRAVTTKAGAAYAPRLLALPRFLCGASDWDACDILQGLDLMGYFLNRSVLAHAQNTANETRMGFTNKAPELPPARQRLSDYYKRVCSKNKNFNKDIGCIIN